MAGHEASRTPSRQPETPPAPLTPAWLRAHFDPLPFPARMSALARYARTLTPHAYETLYRALDAGDSDERHTALVPGRRTTQPGPRDRGSRRSAARAARPFGRRPTASPRTGPGTARLERHQGDAPRHLPAPQAQPPPHARRQNPARDPRTPWSAGRGRIAARLFHPDRESVARRWWTRNGPAGCGARRHAGSGGSRPVRQPSPRCVGPSRT
jgi:hypothetical protein